MTALLLQDQGIEDLITEYQPRLFAFIFSLTKDRTQAQDILQNTNLVLWSKRDNFELGSNFKAWSFQIAFLEVKQARSKLYSSKESYALNEELLESLQAESYDCDESFELRREKLKDCLIKLEQEQKELIIDRYYGNESVQLMANERGVSPNTMAKQLYRIRKALMNCVDKQLKATEAQTFTTSQV
jgi:RNA polymerase sigma-70 factor (ECF subfamily)